MFLNYLNEANKNRFLKLSMHAALCNGLFETEEKEMIDSYCKEMDLKNGVKESDESLESVLEELKENANKVEKNIILLEILGLVKADGLYDEKEKEFIEKLIEGLGVNRELASRLNGLFEIYNTVYKELYQAIIE